jgi:hypothetical protein
LKRYSIVNLPYILSIEFPHLQFGIEELPFVRNHRKEYQKIFWQYGIFGHSKPIKKLYVARCNKMGIIEEVEIIHNSITGLAPSLHPLASPFSFIPSKPKDSSTLTNSNSNSSNYKSFIHPPPRGERRNPPLAPYSYASLNQLEASLPQKGRDHIAPNLAPQPFSAKAGSSWRNFHKQKKEKRIQEMHAKDANLPNPFIPTEKEQAQTQHMEIMQKKIDEMTKSLVILTEKLSNMEIATSQQTSPQTQISIPKGRDDETEKAKEFLRSVPLVSRVSDTIQESFEFVSSI